MIEQMYVTRITKKFGKHLRDLEYEMSKDFDFNFENFKEHYNHGNLKFNYLDQYEKMLKSIPNQLMIHHCFFTFVNYVKFGKDDSNKLKRLYVDVNCILHYGEDK